MKWKKETKSIDQKTYLSVFSANAAKYGPEKTLYLDTFHTVNSLNVRLWNPQLNKIKSAIKNKTEVVFILSSNMIDWQFWWWD